MFNMFQWIIAGLGISLFVDIDGCCPSILVGGLPKQTFEMVRTGDG